MVCLPLDHDSTTEDHHMCQMVTWTVFGCMQLDEGDYVDYVFTNEEGSTKLKRVRVVKIEDTGMSGEKLKIYLRAWRSPQDP